MSLIRRLVKVVYVNIMPSSARESALAHNVKRLLFGHDWIYDADYYDVRRSGAVASAVRMADSIMDEYRPSRVIDVGCGTGDLIEALQARQCVVSGLEYSKAAVLSCRDRNLDVQRFDLERDVFDRKDRFDLAISMEVAEHLPERCADQLVGLLTRVAPIVVFTAATPGQGGTGHVNEQPHSYWVAKFSLEKFALDVEVSERWRKQWQASGTIQSWYWKNVMVFVRSQ